jgi:subtilisin family serine protease
LRSCTRNIRIGIIDTSIDRDHPAFRGRNVDIGNFLPDGAARTINWHGTGVLAVLAGSPDSGTPGLIPDAHFFAADVYHADEGGHPMADTASLLRALEWMRDSNVNVINMSMSGPYDELLQKAVADMSARGVLFVAAAGNDGPNAPPSYPAAYEQVIAVTAVDKNLRSYIHASHGDYIDVAAPGVGIWTAIPNLMEGYQSGTSFAVPHVTAILAAAQGQVQDKSKEGFLRALAIRDLGPAGRDPIYGRGLVTAPSGCFPGEEPSGWVADVVRTPAAHLPPINAGFTRSFK